MTQTRSDSPDDRTGVGSLWDLVSRRADADSTRVLAVDQDNVSLTFGQLRERAEAVAAGLAERGIGQGDVVSWQLPSRLDTIVLFCALNRLGAIQNPLIPMLREPDVEFICRQTRAKLLIVPSVFRGYDHLEMARSIASRLAGLQVLDADAGLPAGEPATLAPRSEPAPDAPSWLFYTSGTTAEPKGAKHVDAGLLAASRTFCANLRLTPSDRVTALAPIAHVGGVLHVMSALHTGSQIVISDVFDPASTPEQLRDAEVTLGGSGVPFLQVYLRRQQECPDEPFFPKARAFLVGGSARPPALHYQVKEILGGIGLVSGYGLTECPYVSWGSVEDPDDKLAGTEGKAGDGVLLKVLDPDGKPVAAGESGELRVRGPQLMLGYVDPALDAQAFDEDGYFRTGDLAMLDEAGYLTITGRIKDVVIRNMENISAREIENLALTFENASDVAAIGLPDPETGERVVAVVVPADPAKPPTLAQLCEHLRAAGLNPRKLPVQLELVTELPRNAMGKVLKKDLKAQFTS